MALIYQQTISHYNSTKNVFEQLQQLLKGNFNLTEQHYFQKNTALLIQCMQFMQSKSLIKAPQSWQKMYLSNLQKTIDYKGCTNDLTILFYFKVASKLTQVNHIKQFTLARMIQLLKIHREQTTSSLLDPKTKEIEIDHYKINLKLTTKKQEENFILKLARQICKYFKKKTYSECVDLFAYYTVSCPANNQLFRLTIIQSYFYYLAILKHNAVGKLCPFKLLDYAIENLNQITLESQIISKLKSIFNIFLILLSQKIKFQFLLMIKPGPKDFLQKLLLFLQKQQLMGIKQFQKKITQVIINIRETKTLLHLPNIQTDFTQTSSQLNQCLYMACLQNYILNYDPKEDSVKKASSMVTKLNFIEKQQYKQMLKLIISDLWNLKISPVYKNNLQLFVTKMSQIKQKFNQLQKWEPLLLIVVSLIQKMPDQQKYIQQMIISQGMILWIFLVRKILGIGVFQIKNQKSLVANYIVCLSKKSSNQQILYFQFIYFLVNICLEKEADLVYNTLSSLFQKVKIAQFSRQNENIANIFHSLTQFRNSLRTQKVKPRIMCTFGKIAYLILRQFIQCYNSIDSKNRESLNKWNFCMTYAVETLGFYASDMEEEDYHELVCKAAGKDSTFIQNIIRITIDKIQNSTRSSVFLKCQHTRAVVQSLLNFTTDLFLEKVNKNGLSDEQKLFFIDFGFNVEQFLVTMLHQLKLTNKQQFSSVQQFIQKEILNFSDRQARILQKQKIVIISQMFKRLKHYGDNLNLMISVSLKKVFYIVFKQQNRQKIAPQIKEDSQIQLHSTNIQQNSVNLDVQTQQISFKFKSLNPIILTIFQVLQSFLKKCNTWNMFGPIKIYSFLRCQSTQTLIDQLNDLFYVFYTCNMEKQARKIMEIRLSVLLSIRKDLFMLELSKYILLEFFTESQHQQLTQILEKQVPKMQNKQFLSLVLLFACNKLVQNFPYKNSINKVIYLLNQHPIVYLHKFRQIISCLSYDVVKFPFINNQVKDYKNIYQNTKGLKFSTLKKQDMYWVKYFWEQGWPVLRLLVLFIKKIISQIVKSNQLSMARSFLSFIQIILLRSGHIADLQTVLDLKATKKMFISCFTLQNFKNMIGDKVKEKQYRKLHEMWLKNRKSQCYNKNPGKLYDMIQKAFEKGGKIGFLLASLCSNHVSRQLNLNQYQKFVLEYERTIFKSKYQHEYQQIYKILKKYVFSGENLKSLLSILTKHAYQNWFKAMIVKSFIGQKIDTIFKKTQNFHIQSSVIDNFIMQVAVCLQQQNYLTKTYLRQRILQSTKSQNYFKFMKQRQRSIQQLSIYCQQTAKNYEYFLQNSFLCNDLKIKQIRDNSRYALSILFPLGSKVYNIAMKGDLLVTFVPIQTFEDKILQCEAIMVNNQNILHKRANDDLGKKAREGFDRQLGKIAASIDVGICDINEFLIPREILIQLKKYHPALPKFLGHHPQIISNHLSILQQRYGFSANIPELVKLLETLWQSLKQKSIRQNILIQLNSKYLQFPFELVNSLRHNKGIFRVPSLKYILDNQNTARRQFCIKNCSYLVNTKKDLQDTQKRFLKMKDSFQSWSGITKEIPDASRFQFLMKKQLFLYMGHGTGLQHVQHEVISQFKIDCLMLIFGCSSAKLVFQNSQPYGTALQMLMNGCPAYLGCLWSVTDVDIDRLTKHMFDNVRSIHNLCELVSNGKICCRYPNLNGSSLVIYGLPAYLTRE